MFPIVQSVYIVMMKLPGWVWLERTWQDVRYGVRLLAATLGFTSITVVSLAIGRWMSMKVPALPEDPGHGSTSR